MKKKNILFICLGNICRSPSAEGVMNALIKNEGLQDYISCDSAGTAAYHVGESPDSRMISHASKRGFELTSIGRQFNPKTDFDKFNYIITMDNSNYRDIKRLDYSNRYEEKIFLMTDFCTVIDVNEVPDPYYGGAAGFEYVLDIIEDACSGLLKRLKDELQQS